MPARDDRRPTIQISALRLHPFLRIRSGSGRRTASLSPAVDAGADRRLLAAAAHDLDRLLVELRAVQLVDDGTAVLLEDRFGRHQRDVRHAVGGDARGRRHAGTDARIALVEDQAEIEVADRRPARREVDARQHGDQVDLRGEVLAGDRFDLHRRGLADLQAAAIGLVEPRFEMDRRQVGQLEDAAPAQARSPSRNSTPPPPNGPPERGFWRMLTDAVGGRARACSASIEALRPLDVGLRLVAPARLPMSSASAPALRRQRSRLDFLQPLLGVAERELRAFVLDARDEVALAEIQLGAIDVVLAPS